MARPKPLLSETFESLKKSHVLDLGSGDGTNIVFVVESRNKSIYPLDIIQEFNGNGVLRRERQTTNRRL